MKVIKKGNNPQEPKRITCPHCGAELEYESSDVVDPEAVDAHVVCPECGSNVLVNDDGSEPTIDTIEYPRHYWHTHTDDPLTKEVSKERIDEHVKKLLKLLREQPPTNVDEGNYTFWESGDTLIFVIDQPGDEEYDVFVSKNYWSAYVSYQEFDRKLHEEAIIR